MTKRTPVSTYRLQVSPDFDLSAATDVVEYVRDLGADWLYLSPVLQAEAGSAHGYDVVDHTHVDTERGGDDAFRALTQAAHAAGLGVLVDIVPNHVGVATPESNPWWWSLLERGQESPVASAFDVDWQAGDGRLRVPVLDDRMLDGVELDTSDPDRPVLRVGPTAYPTAPGTVHPGDDVQTVHDRQHYEFIHWKRADHDLNYRRFFAVNTLAAIRVEDPEVFAASHTVIGEWFRDGLVDGLRIDHPDGLYDPAGYLEDLRALTGGAYTLVEKILEPGEELPASWPVDGTTGYDALGTMDRVFVDPRGEESLWATVGSEPADWQRPHPRHPPRHRRRDPRQRGRAPGPPARGRRVRDRPRATGRRPRRGHRVLRRVPDLPPRGLPVPDRRTRGRRRDPTGPDDVIDRIAPALVDPSMRRGSVCSRRAGW